MITHSVDGIRDDEPLFGDQSSEFDFPVRWLVLLLGAAAAYAAYRMVQTIILLPAPADSRLSVSSRMIVSTVDGCLMALTAPIAWLTTRHLPISAPHVFRRVALHAAVALGVAGLWIVTMIGVYALVTGTRMVSPFRQMYLGWLTTNVFTYSMLVAVLHSLSFQRRLRRRDVQAARLQTQLTTARLENLRSQLNPHFLFNTLNTISELTHVDPAAADRMVTSLARLLRLSLDFSTQTEVRLSREIDVVTSYLELQRMRYGDRLCFEIRIPPELSAVLVPPMLLQPLVENSVRHGITARSSPGKLWVTASAHGRRLRLAVEDNGVGLPEHIIEGVGIGNTRARLNELFGADYTLDIERRAAGGARVVVEFPSSVE